MSDKDKIAIGNNSISYYDEVLKISNISRTSIVIYENKDYQKAIKHHDDKKQAHDKKQNDLFLAFCGGTLLTLFISVVSFLNSSTVFGFILLITTGICGFFAYHAKHTDFKDKRPKRSDYPERYGLCVNMNSSYSSYFTASGEDGLVALRELQKLIDEADERNDTIVYQDNRVNIENKDGVLNIGDNNEIRNKSEGVAS